jgi:uncharacterized cupredoxin-like copper-binding protein
MSCSFLARGTRAVATGLAVALSTVLLAGAAVVAQSPAASMAPMGSPAPVPSMAPAGPQPGDADFVAGTTDAPRHVAMQVNDDLLFAPNVLNIAPNETITFDVTNVGKATHEFKVGLMADALADAEAAPEIADITADTTQSLTYTFEGAGPFGFVCHEPGHLEHGMVGYIFVVGGDAPAVGTVEAPRQVLITMDDHLKFAPDAIDVKPGETIEFVLQNVGKAVHEFQVGDAAMVAADTVDGVKVVEVDGIDALHVVTVSYTFAEGGTYAFACHEPGHFEAGMQGVVNLVP